MEEKTWLGVTPNQIADDLIKRFGIGAPAVPGLVDKFVQLDVRLRDDFTSFWQTGNPVSKSVEGFTAERLVAEWNMTGPGAFSTLAWLPRDPAEAKEALRRGFSMYRPTPPPPLKS